MKKIATLFSALTLSAALAGCTTAEQSAGAGALIGGGAAALAGGDTGEIVAGTAVGAGAGYLLGRVAGGNCRYRAADGSTYIARCP
jgi:hypothetical protein